MPRLPRRRPWPPRRSSSRTSTARHPRSGPAWVRTTGSSALDPDEPHAVRPTISTVRTTRRRTVRILPVRGPGAVAAIVAVGGPHNLALIPRWPVASLPGADLAYSTNPQSNAPARTTTIACRWANESRAGLRTLQSTWHRIADGPDDDEIPGDQEQARRGKARSDESACAGPSGIPRPPHRGPRCTPRRRAPHPVAATPRGGTSPPPRHGRPAPRSTARRGRRPA